MTRLSQSLSLQPANGLTPLSPSRRLVSSSSVKFSGASDAIHLRFAGTSDTPPGKLTLEDIEAILQEQNERMVRGHQSLLENVDMNLGYIQKALDSKKIAEYPQLAEIFQAAKDCLKAIKNIQESLDQQHQQDIKVLQRYKTTVPDLKDLTPDEARPYLDQLFKELGAFNQGFPVDKVQQLIAQRQEQFKQLVICNTQILQLVVPLLSNPESLEGPEACKAQLEALKVQIEGIAQTAPSSEEHSTPHAADKLTSLTFEWALKSMWDTILRDLRTKHFSDIPRDIREIWQKYKSSIPQAALHDLGDLPPKPKQD